jgi:SAM-dependent methyltransferase
VRRTPDEEACAAWERLSAVYQEFHGLAADDVHYGAWAPGERELRLLGNLRGKRVLEVGCGGGQNCLALARRGAAVTGLDFSRAQVAHAEALAAQELAAGALAAAEYAQLQFVTGAAEELADVPDATCDLVLSVNTFPYVRDMAACLAACRRVLRSGGQLVFGLDHPLRACFAEQGLSVEDEELSIVPARSYYDRTPRRWQWGSTGVILQTYHRTVGEWTDLLAGAHLQMLRLVEPPPPAALLDAVWPEDDALAPLRYVPHVLILVAQKA